MTERYAQAGVRLDAAEDAKRRIVELARRTRTPLALGRLGAFGGMVRVPPGYTHPVLVLSTDGVGTKVLVAARAGRHDTVGEDLVNHCVNDILVHGARPLAFLDYIAAGSLDASVAAAIVEGVARGCRVHDMTLAGGETAQLPDLYTPGGYDLAGTIVGVVEESRAIHGDRVTPGDALIGFASTGLHTNGYSLARHIVFDQLKLDLGDAFPDTGRTVAEILLTVHQSYGAAVAPVLDRVHALATSSDERTYPGLAQGPDGAIYAATGPSGVLLRIDHGQVERFLVPEATNLFSIAFDARGRPILFEDTVTPRLEDVFVWSVTHARSAGDDRADGVGRLGKNAQKTGRSPAHVIRGEHLHHRAADRNTEGVAET